MSSIRGGYGNAPHGRTNFGSAESTFEPRFFTSKPTDLAVRTPTDEWVRFTIYHTTGHVALDNVKIEISENGGGTYTLAVENQVFIAPFSGRVRRKDGQTIIVFIEKDSPWASGSEIIIRYTGPNEFGQVASKDLPVVWS